MSNSKKSANRKQLITPRRVARANPKAEVKKPEKKLVQRAEQIPPKSLENHKRQEAFNSADGAYLASKPKIVLSKKLGSGGYGDFYTIEGNENLGVKVPRCWIEDPNLKDLPIHARNPSMKRSCSNCVKKRDIIHEAKKAHSLRVDERPMLASTRMVSVQRGNKKCIGLVRQLVKTINFGEPEKLTDSQLETIRRRLIELSKSGIILYDGLQIGFTKSGRVLQYDLGKIETATISSAFYQNNQLWITLLALAGKFAVCRAKSSIVERVQCEEEVHEKYGLVA